MEVDDKTFEIKAGVTVTVYPGEKHEIRYKQV
jgi:mannose-6-phosphate isomerase-like protein (cupin superfamily)